MVVVLVTTSAAVGIEMVTAAPVSGPPNGSYRGKATTTAYEPVPNSEANGHVGESFEAGYRLDCSAAACTLDGPLFGAGTGPVQLSGGGGTWTIEIPRPVGDDCPPHSPTTVTVTGDEAKIVVEVVSHYHKSICGAGHTNEISGSTIRFTGTLVVPPTIPTTVPASTVPGAGPSPAQGKPRPNAAPAANGRNGYQRASLAAVAAGRRSSVPAAVVRPADALDGGLGHLVQNALIAGLLVLLLVFPSQLFNNTYSANQERVDASLAKLPFVRRRPAGAPTDPPVPIPFARQVLTFGTVAVAGALLGQFLDPHVKVDTKTVALFVGILLAIGLDKLVDAVVGRGFRSARHQSVDGVLRAAPLGLLIAAACVVISRTTHFQPGYLYGLIGGWSFAVAMDRDDEGQGQFVASGIALLLALAAWIAFVPVADSANGAHPGIGILMADSVLAAFFIGGIEGLLFGLTPLRFMPGHTLSRWSWWAWGLLAAAVSFVFVQVLLRPSSGYLGRSTTASVTVTVALFVGFGLASVSFWAWFRTHPDPATATPPTEPDASVGGQAEMDSSAVAAAGAPPATSND